MYESCVQYTVLCLLRFYYRCIKLNETDSTSSSRIFIKILFQELAEYIGLVALNQRLQDPYVQDVLIYCNFLI